MFKNSEQLTHTEQTQCIFDEILNSVDFGLIQGFPLDLYLRIKELTEGVEVELNPNNE
jgi:hypothetical protein